MIKRTLSVLILGVIFTLNNICYSQATVQFRIQSVYTNLDDMDLFTSGDSDPTFNFFVSDNSGNINEEYYLSPGTNCMGTRTINKVIFNNII